MNKQEKKNIDKTYYQRNKERINQRAQTWRTKNPDYYKDYCKCGNLKCMGSKRCGACYFKKAKKQ